MAIRYFCDYMATDVAKGDRPDCQREAEWTVIVQEERGNEFDWHDGRSTFRHSCSRHLCDFLAPVQYKATVERLQERAKHGHGDGDGSANAR